MSDQLKEPVFTNLAEFEIGAWPSFLPRPSDISILNRVWLSVLETRADAAKVSVSAGLFFEEELTLSIPGLDAVTLTIGASGAGDAIVPLELEVYPDLQIRIRDVPVALRLKTDLLRPARRVVTMGADAPSWELDPSKDHVEIALGQVMLDVDGDGNISVSSKKSINLPPSLVGDTGVVIEAQDISLYLDGRVNPPGRPPGWRGVHILSARVYLPGELASTVGELALTDAYIGNGGFSGAIDAEWTPTPLSTDLFALKFDLEHVKLTFVQNALTESIISGTLTLPYFDKRLAVEIGIGLSGSFVVKVAGAADSDDTYDVNTGLLTLEKKGLLRLTVESISFALEDGFFTTKIAGQVTPLFGKSQGLDWPTFQVKELVIDSKGNVRLESGWLDLREQYALDFHGFQMEITKLGFGKTEDGGKWIGFSGSLKLAEGLPAGASVEGLRLIWYDDGSGSDAKLTFNGVGVEFEVPDVLDFKGAVSYGGREEVDIPNVGRETIERFDGAIKLNLQSLDMQLDGTLVVGSARGARGSYNFFAIFLSAELPAGIPLWSTGLALYGMAGLFALQMKPNKQANEGWYENPDRTPGWYKRGEPGVTDLKTKWEPSPGDIAFGAGVTIGTESDNGRTFNGRLILVLVFPGPIILLEGRGDVLKERTDLDTPTSEPLFRALAVLDKRAGNLTVGLDAQYKYREQGELIDIRGGVEAFFDFRNADAWHIYLGEKEPREKRIRARAFKLFESNSYFMLDAHRVAMGAWVGYDKRWKFGPLRVTLQAWIEGNAALSIMPPQFHGDLWLHGKAELRAFGIGVGLTVDAEIAADVFEPFHLLGKFKVKLKTPWPLPDPRVTVKLEWGPEPTRPPLPLPLKEIAVEHLKVTTSWPLPRNRLILPNYDSNGDGFLDGPTGATEPANLTNVPIVPLDARPHITFGRHVNDDALVGVSVTQPVFERIGDPASGKGPVKVRYGLKEVALHKRVNNGWELVAQKPKPTTANARELYGSWAPVPPPPEATLPTKDGSVGQTKLWLWSKTPFDYSRHSGRAWDEWFTDRFGEYPCVTEHPEQEVCCEFESIKLQVSLPYTFPDGSGVEVARLKPETRPIKILDSPVAGLSRALCVPYVPFTGPSYSISITLPRPQLAEAVKFTRADSGQVEAHVYDANDNQLKRVVDREGKQTLEIRVAGINRLKIGSIPFIPIAGTGEQNPDEFCLVQVCFKTNGVWSCHDFHRLPLALPWQCDRHPKFVLDSPRVPNTFGQSIVMELREPVAGLTRALCFSREFTVIPVAASAVTFNDLVEVRLIVPARALKLTLMHPTGVTATGYDSADNPYEPVQGGTPDQPHLTVIGDDLKRVVLNADPAHEICILQACVMEVVDLNRHLSNGLVRWAQEDEVLEPDTTYRLKTVTTIQAQGEGELPGYSENKELTEYAYFRTEGPPGLAKLSAPEGQSQNDFQSGLDNLTLYVEHTVPNTIPAPGEKPLLPRPVYRAYDVGVRFNVNYVELMYRLAGRDLGLYLYDNNDRPVRDAQGRLIVLSNRWGIAEEATLTEGEERWLFLLAESGCVEDPAAPTPQAVLSDTTLVSAAEGQVLEGDTLYEARLVPLLLHEAFSEALAGWTTVGGALSDWERRGHATLRGKKATAGGAVVKLDGSPNLSGLDPLFDFIVLQADTVRPFGRYRIVSVDDAGKMVTVDGSPRLTTATTGWEIPELSAIVVRSSGETTLVREKAEHWSDYRVSVLLRLSSDKPVGLAFRYRQDSNDHYRFTMDRSGASGGGRRMLQKVISGISETLAEGEFDHQQNRDYFVTVEVIGAMLRVYQDGALVIEHKDDSLSTGGIGLYSEGSTGARFGDVRVDDFGVSSPVAYRFSFTTSRFTNFFHHLHSFQDETWQAALAPSVDFGAVLDAAVPTATRSAPSEAEARAYETLARQVLGAAAAQNPAEVQVTRVERTAAGGPTLALALLIQGPEPMDWSRTALEVQCAERQVLRPEIPGAVKLTDVTFGTNEPNEESVTLLLRETTALNGYRIDFRPPPSPGAETAWTPYYTFTQEGLLSAGTRVRVFAGNEADAPPAQRGVVRHFVAPQGEPGQLRLSAQAGAQLRIRGPGETGGHVRQFLPAADYMAVDTRMLRKADGTGFFLMPATDSPLTIGQYRLKLTYRRDDGSDDSSSIVFSEAGDSADERVTLDAPW